MILSVLWHFLILNVNYILIFQVFKKLTTFFKSLGVKAVFDTNCSKDITLIETCNEFIARYKQSQESDDGSSKSSLPMLSSACPGMYVYVIMVCVRAPTCLEVI